MRNKYHIRILYIYIIVLTCLCVYTHIVAAERAEENYKYIVNNGILIERNLELIRGNTRLIGGNLKLINSSKKERGIK